jgi:large subunit ribosomal protein L22
VPETRASIRYLRTSPSKVREVLGLIRGREIDDARERLRYCERGPAGDVLKLLDSAVANAESNDNLPEDELFVVRAFADEGPTLKRWRPRARGRGTRIRKRTSHVTIVVSRFSDEELERRRRREAAATGPTRRRLRRPTRRRRARELERAEEVDRELEGAEEAEEHDHEHEELVDAEEREDVSAADEEAEEAEEDGEDVALADVPDVGDDAVPLGQAAPVEPAAPAKKAPAKKKAPATKKPTKKATTAKKPTAKKAKSTKKTTKKKDT